VTSVDGGGDAASAAVEVIQPPAIPVDAGTAPIGFVERSSGAGGLGDGDHGFLITMLLGQLECLRVLWLLAVGGPRGSLYKARPQQLSMRSGAHLADHGVGFLW